MFLCFSTPLIQIIKMPVGIFIQICLISVDDTDLSSTSKSPIRKRCCRLDYKRGAKDYTEIWRQKGFIRLI